MTGTITYQPENKSVFVDPTLRLRPKTVDAAIESLIGYGYPFSADDVHDMVTTGNRNTIGRKFAELAADGRITRIGDLRSSQKSRKGSRISLWINSKVVESAVQAAKESPVDTAPADPWADASEDPWA